MVSCNNFISDIEELIFMLQDSPVSFPVYCIFKESLNF